MISCVLFWKNNLLRSRVLGWSQLHSIKQFFWCEFLGVLLMRRMIWRMVWKKSPPYIEDEDLKAIRLIFFSDLSFFRLIIVQNENCKHCYGCFIDWCSIIDTKRPTNGQRTQNNSKSNRIYFGWENWKFSMFLKRQYSRGTMLWRTG